MNIYIFANKTETFFAHENISILYMYYIPYNFLFIEVFVIYFVRVIWLHVLISLNLDTNLIYFCASELGFKFPCILAFNC